MTYVDCLTLPPCLAVEFLASQSKGCVVVVLFFSRASSVTCGVVPDDWPPPPASCSWLVRWVSNYRGWLLRQAAAEFCRATQRCDTPLRISCISKPVAFRRRCYFSGQGTSCSGRLLQRAFYRIAKHDYCLLSLTASAVPLQVLSVSRNTDCCFPASTRSAVSVCPFAVLDCTTFVNVTSGFWTNISESGGLGDGLRCPVGYCGCKNSRVCSLPPAISINRNRDPLCNRNRTGKLCGGCLPNFTQSMDEMTCITNEECSRNLWWVWLLSIIGFVLYSLYIVVSIWKLENGIACLLFYFQMSSFATDSVESNGLVSFLEYAQLNSVMALYEGACYAPNMSAYNSTAFRLLGPLLVLLFAVA